MSDSVPDENNAEAHARELREELQRIKTGSFERRLSMTTTGLTAGSRYAGHAIANLFRSKERRREAHRELMGQQAQYLADELGKLKGSVVKIGQMMALYGEHFLPPEVTEALHTLEDKTVALEWAAIREVLVRELGQEKLEGLEIEHHPIGAASLGQVHRAWRLGDGLEICLKTQYPGVAEAVDSDIDAVAQLLKLARVIPSGQDFDEWLDEVRHMMHREVDYVLEARTTEHFRHLLIDDERYVVPRIIKDLSTRHVMASTFELGFPVTAAEVQRLPLARRNHLAMAALELFLREIFIWGEIQTDPNFGNYRVRIAEDPEHPEERDHLVLLDFGAVQEFPQSFLVPIQNMIRAAYENDVEGLIQGSIDLHFMQADWPREVLEDFARTCMACLEPLARDRSDVPSYAINEKGEYKWKESNLPRRVAKQAARSAISKYFKIPPKEFVFLNRKLIGVFTMISVLGAEFNAEEMLKRYIYPDDHALERR